MNGGALEIGSIKCWALCCLWLFSQRHELRMMTDFRTRWSTLSSLAVTNTHTRAFWMSWLISVWHLEPMLGPVGLIFLLFLKLSCSVVYAKSYLLLSFLSCHWSWEFNNYWTVLFQMWTTLATLLVLPEVKDFALSFLSTWTIFFIPFFRLAY